MSVNVNSIEIRFKSHIVKHRVMYGFRTYCGRTASIARSETKVPLETIECSDCKEKYEQSIIPVYDQELWEKCKEYMKHWETSDPERRQVVMNTLQQMKKENLELMNTVLGRARTLDTLIAVLNSRADDDKEPIPEPYLKAFGELKK